MTLKVLRKEYVDEPSFERPIKIHLNDVLVAVSQGSPYELEELAIGFLLSEGLLSDREKVRSVTAHKEDLSVFVLSDEYVSGEFKTLKRVTSSGCAQASILVDPVRHERAITSDQQFSADDLYAMEQELCSSGPKRNEGECVHGCALGKAGSLLYLKEDIGRHNAMDKLIGQAWLDQVSFEDAALFTTGRASREMVQKAVQAGVCVMVTQKGATDSAVRVAHKAGLTLVAQCKNDVMTILCHDHRVV